MRNRALGPCCRTVEPAQRGDRQAVYDRGAEQQQVDARRPAGRELALVLAFALGEIEPCEPVCEQLAHRRIMQNGTGREVVMRRIMPDMVIAERFAVRRAAQIRDRRVVEEHQPAAQPVFPRKRREATQRVLPIRQARAEQALLIGGGRHDPCERMKHSELCRRGISAYVDRPARCRCQPLGLALQPRARAARQGREPGVLADAQIGMITHITLSDEQQHAAHVERADQPRRQRCDQVTIGIGRQRRQPGQSSAQDIIQRACDTDQPARDRRYRPRPQLKSQRDRDRSHPARSSTQFDQSCSA